MRFIVLPGIEAQSNISACLSEGLNITSVATADPLCVALLENLFGLKPIIRGDGSTRYGTGGTSDDKFRFDLIFPALRIFCAGEFMERIGRDLSEGFAVNIDGRD